MSFYFFFKKYQKEIESHPALKKVFSIVDGDEKKEDLGNMCTKNAKNASAFVSALRDDLSTLEAYRNGVSEIVGNYPDLRDKYNLEDIRDLKSLLVRLTYAGPSKKGLKRTERKLKEMVRTISSVEEAETSR